MESRDTQEPPGFLFPTHSTLSSETFLPSLTSRRGELQAWIGTLLIGAVGGFELWKTRSVSFFTLAIFFMLLIAAVVISFGNWVDRRTSIRISSETVCYRSPLRKVELSLNDIESLWAIPAGGGWRVFLRGGKRYFQFRTESRLTTRSGSGMQTGVEGGEQLAGFIRTQAGLSEPEFEDGVWVCRRI